MDEQIMTLNPAGKAGVTISRDKYDLVRAVILDTIHDYGELTFLELFSLVIQKLTGNFDGSIGWYVTTVKLDLEARGLIERNTATLPQRLRLAS